MGVLTKKQERKLIKLFVMDEGYVLDFSNRTFTNFLLDSVNVEINDEKYLIYGDSKAKKLRAFWDIESPYKIKKLLTDLIDHKIELEKQKVEYNEEYIIDEGLILECKRIVESISDSGTGEVIEDLEKFDIEDTSIDLLLKNIKENIENLEPQLALDRLHTFSVKYMRNICRKYNIEFKTDEPLNSCYGKYVKYLKQEGLIESDMTNTILNYSISLFDKFNSVRNNQSYAHDNDILNYHESLLIIRSMSNVLAFIDSIEKLQK